MPLSSTGHFPTPPSAEISPSGRVTTWYTLVVHTEPRSNDTESRCCILVGGMS